MKVLAIFILLLTSACVTSHRPHWLEEDGHWLLEYVGKIVWRPSDLMDTIKGNDFNVLLRNATSGVSHPLRNRWPRLESNLSYVLKFFLLLFMVKSNEIREKSSCCNVGWSWLICCSAMFYIYQQKTLTENKDGNWQFDLNICHIPAFS